MTPPPDAINLVAALQTDLKQIIYQGGPEVSLFFEPLSLEETTKTDLYALLESLKSAKRLIKSACRSSGLRVTHDRNKGVFQKVKALILLPDRWTNYQLPFTPVHQVNTSELR